MTHIEEIECHRLGIKSQCIPNENLVLMLKRIAHHKPIKAREAKGEGRTMKLVGKVLLIGGSLYFAIHLLAYLVRP